MIATGRKRILPSIRAEPYDTEKASKAVESVEENRDGFSLFYCRINDFRKQKEERNQSILVR